MNTDRAITVANDETLVGLISQAQTRLVVLAPGLNLGVAERLAQRWRELGPDRVTVILDIDPEVYRLGYGDFEALQLLDGVASEVGGILQRQPGIRIGLVLADGKTLVYSPTPKLIDAGPSSPQTPNAVILDAPPAKVLAELGQGENGVKDQVVGLDNAQRRDIAAVSKDLKQNPPQKFEIAQAVRVFNAKFEFVEFELIGTQIERKTIQIPPELMGLARDEHTKRLLRTSFRVVGDREALSGQRLQKAKAWIVKNYLTVLPGYGTVVLRSIRPEFEKKVAQLVRCVERFERLVQKRLQAAMDRSLDSLVEALLPSVTQNPPQHWKKYGPLDQEAVQHLFRQELARTSGTAESLIKGMKTKLVFKGVTYDSLCDPKFVETVRNALPGLGQLATEFDAAKAKEGEPQLGLWNIQSA